MQSPGLRLGVIRTLAAVVLLLICAYGAWTSSRAGASRLLSFYGASQHSLAVVNEAAVYAPTDPEALYARAIVLMDQGRTSEAVSDFESAVRLRPSDYFLWLELGRARELAGDEQGAGRAYRQSVSLAPAYAIPHWHLGNLLLRNGQLDDAFTELRLASASDEQLLPALADLAWGAYDGDVSQILKAVEPKTNPARLALARVLITHDKTPAALALIRGISGYETERLSFISELLADKRFVQAFAVWLTVHSDEESGTLRDGDFEGGTITDTPSFFWSIRKDLRNIRLLLDTDNPQSGAHCLRLEFAGDSSPAAALLSQLVIVRPNTHYQLQFAARTRDLKTGGPLLVAIGDPVNTARAIAQSESLPIGTSDWRLHTLSFTTDKEMNAVRVVVRRQDCASSPCPVFGQAWLDGFVLRTVAQ